MKLPTTTDALIIGSGISGLMCALTLADSKHVVVLSKKKVSTTATAMAQGGIASVDTTTNDTFAKHAYDTEVAGEWHNDSKTVQIIVEQAPEIIEILKSYGARFDSEYTLEGGHSHHRIHHAKDTTGKSIENALIKAIKKHKNIVIIEQAMAIDLLMQSMEAQKKKCIGCTYIHKKKIHTLISKNTILATGGAGQLYTHTTNPLVATGDGIAMAHRAGAETKDLEFVQFHPTALLDASNPHFLLSESLRGEGAVLRNEDGEVFMKKYDPRGDLAPRDKVSQAIFLEQKKKKVFLDISHKPAEWIKDRFPTIYGMVQRRIHRDMTKVAVPITPVAHYLCGGVTVGTEGKTSIPHLYAIGETACTGLHGANRLASNSLLEGAVYGLNAARDIINQKNIKSISAKKGTDFSYASQAFRMNNVRKKIQTIMWSHVGIQRTPEGLKKAIFELERLKGILPPRHIVNPELEETRNLLDTGLLIAKAAQKRKKSLGCHWIKE